MTPNRHYSLVLRSWHTIAATLLLLASVLHAVPAPETAKAATTLTPAGGRIVVDVQGAPPAPFFFSAVAENTVRVTPSEISGMIRLKLHVVQGKAEVLSLGLSGDGEVVEVTGASLRDWSVRQTPDKKRFLDIRPVVTEGATELRDLDITVRTKLVKPTVPGDCDILLAAPGSAVGFVSTITLQTDPALELRVTAAVGLSSVGETVNGNAPLRFTSGSEGTLSVRLMPRGAAIAEAELVGAQLEGKIDEQNRSGVFRLRGQLKATKPGARLRLLAGDAAPADKSTGDGWHIEIAPPESKFDGYEMVAEREGLIPVDLSFAAPMYDDSEWRLFKFTMPAGAIVPLQLLGLPAGVSFDPARPVRPVTAGGNWQGYLPADGAAAFAWKHQPQAAEGTLFFTTAERMDSRLGAGLLRQESSLEVQVLQGKLTALRCRLAGPGDVVGVDAPGLLSWRVVAADNARALEIQLSRPIEQTGTIVVRSQTALGGFPIGVEPLRLVPEGVVRHSGHVRIANDGAVRLEVANVAGMMQLAPEQFPGSKLDEDSVRQVFVYSYPSSEYGYKLLASQIQPEVAVSAVLTYKLGETDRSIEAALELDIREAPLRDWSLLIPADHTVVSLTGAGVADFAAESATHEGLRVLKVLFGEPVEGRQLLQIRLERNIPAAAGDWNLPPLRFPGAKTVRGHIGAVATAGYRLIPAGVERLVEVPLSYFPQQIAGLQQAWRLREADWTAALKVEALGQSVQADVFHLYTVQEGVVHASVLLNFFVVGAPATEWRLSVPAEAGNLDVIGQNVRRDWRRENDQVVVSLHQPVLGAATLLLTFQQPIGARGGLLQPGQVRPLNVQAERGYVQVVSPVQVKHQIRRAEGSLLKLEALELPTEFRLLSSAPSLAVYQYTGRPFALDLGVEWYEAGETVEQAVDFAQLSSQIAGDGQVVTDAVFFVKTRGRQALRMELPAGTRLWETRVEGGIVNARADGGLTIVPLPPRLNPNEPVRVSLRIGQPSTGSATVRLAAPRPMAPCVIHEWTLRSDSGRQLVPRGGNAELIRPVLTETGFEWVARRGMLGAIVLCCMAFAGILLARAGGWARVFGMLLFAGVVFGASCLAVAAILERSPNLQTLTYAATMVPADKGVVVYVANLPQWMAMVSWWGVAAVLAGSALAVMSHRLGYTTARPAGIALAAGGLLVQHGGAVLFMGLVACAVLALLLVPTFMRWRREGRTGETMPPLPPAGGSASVAAIVVFAGVVAAALAGLPLRAQGQNTAAGTPELIRNFDKAALSSIQTWTIRDGRLQADLEFVVRGGPGDSFLLLRPPAVLTDFKADGLRLVKSVSDKAINYHVTPERDGVFTARVRYELPVPKVIKRFMLPTGLAAIQKLTIDMDQGGWQFQSDAVAQVLPTPNLGEGRSGATLVLKPRESVSILMEPRQRDLASEATQFIAETEQLYLPGPGVVNGQIRVSIRPVQGRVALLRLAIPAAFTVGQVGGNGAAGESPSWRFDPEKHRLEVMLDQPTDKSFRLGVMLQRSTEALPCALSLEPVRVLDAAGDVGMIAIAFGGNAQPEGVRATNLTEVNTEDFDMKDLAPETASSDEPPTIRQAWRFGQEGGSVSLTVAPVAAEVRVQGRQVLSLDDDRLVMAVDLTASISRVGVFKLSFALPAGLELEALSGRALANWTEAVEGEQRIVTMHLNGRTIGEQKFSLSLAGPAPRAQKSWPVPHLVIREATRQTGEAIVVPGRGLRLRAEEREKVSQLDPRQLGGLQPGALAFRLLQEDWSIRLSIESLEPWVTVQSLQETTVREGQTLVRLGMRYRVENAAVKKFRVRLPGLDEERARTVRATGTAVSDLVRVAGSDNLWEIRLHRGVAGETDVQIEYQGPATGDQKLETLTVPEFEGVRQAVQYAVVRAGGRLELEPGVVPRGWTRTDWSAVPAFLQNRADRSMPALCYRVAEAEGPLPVNVRRHEVAAALKLRVTEGSLTTLLAPDGAGMTAVELKIDVLEKSTLRVRLPEGSRLFQTLVNGECVAVVREGDAFLFYVTPSAAGERRAAVRLVYSTSGGPGGELQLVGPRLGVPLESVNWRLVLPPGYEMSGYSGGLRLRRQQEWYGADSRDDYMSFMSNKRSVESKKAADMLQQANEFMQRGDQQKAGEALSRAYNTQALDEAANEDARVQLRNLRAQQTVLGLNTRRQRLYLDNRAEAARNEQLEQAASINPFMQGKLNFDPQQVDQLLMGNSADENSALRGIADRLVDQQLAAEPAPRALDVTLTERGQVVVFERSLQVEGDQPLQLAVGLARSSRPPYATAALLLLSVAALAAIPLSRKQ